MDTITIGVRNNTLFVKRGALFTGSTYKIVYDGVADTNVLLRLYAVRSTIETAHCVAQTEGDTLAMTSSTWHEVFEANGYRELMTLKAYLYNGEGDIVASGDVQVRMSPTKGVYDGKPVDVVGPPGADGKQGEQGPAGNDGKQGEQGPAGNDGKTYTPKLREQNGEVFVDFVEGNTTLSGNINIRGKQGEQGKEGKQGEQGESAFEAAKKGGYTGNEEAFNTELANLHNAVGSCEDAAAKAASDYAKVSKLAGEVVINAQAVENSVGTAKEEATAARNAQAAAESARDGAIGAYEGCENFKTVCEEAQKASTINAQGASESAIVASQAEGRVLEMASAVAQTKDAIDKSVLQVKNSADNASRYASTAQKAQIAAEKAKTAAATAVEMVADYHTDVEKWRTQAKAAAESAQTNADAVANDKTAVETAKTQAETAKSDAVKAQGEASKSASEASTSASNAKTSETNAKTSENNAKTTADALNAGLATLNSFDGRVTKLEDGRGAYRDPATGKVYFYTPCPVGDGTLVQLQTTGGIDRITLVEGLPKGAGISISKVSGDDFVIFCDGNTYVYDKTFNRIGSVDGTTVTSMYRNGFIYRAYSNKVEKRNVLGVTTGNAYASYTLPTQAANQLFIAFNPKTGHIVAGYWYANKYKFYLFDEDLVAICDANNEPIIREGTVPVDWGYSPNNQRNIAQIWNTKNVAFFNDVTFAYDAGLSCTLFMLDDTDTPVVVHENLPAFDEATGKTILATDASGNLIKEGRLYKPVVTGEKIRIKSREQIESNRVSSTAYYNILTPFTDRYGQTYLTNLVDEYVVYADGTIVDKYRYCKGDVTSATPNYSATKRAVKVNDLNNSNGAMRLIYVNAGTDVSQGGRTEVALLAVWSDNGCFYKGALGHGTTGAISFSDARTQIFFVNPSILYQSFSPQTANGARYGLWTDVLFKHNGIVYGGSK